MNSSARHRLLNDALTPGALADSLAATRRAARRRRVRRHTARAAALVGVGVVGAWWFRQIQPTDPPIAVVKSTPAPSFIRVTSAPEDGTVVVRTASTPSTLIVSTGDAADPTPRASEDELFALAGARPAALHRLADGSARWMWLDGP